MKRLLLPALAAACASAPAAAADDRGRTYLLSIAHIPFRANERAVGFTIASWGVDYRALCHIPFGWQFRAGGDATPAGRLEGEGKQGVTFLGDLAELRSIALVRLRERPRWKDRPIEGGIIPATFVGTLDLSSGRKVRLGPGSVRLAPASACPPPR